MPGVPQGNPGFFVAGKESVEQAGGSRAAAHRDVQGHAMSYQVLARKWRPQVFEDVAGQEHITRTLQNAITSNRLAHAFLFSGPRGVGKTTTARILAKALNCVDGPTARPCGVCDSCRETAAGTAVDVIEIDGASNRGIEHIRELRETVKYAPAGGKYKVYVIDEVHMLTNEAFNALLKTLEEPPPSVLFIFATTEPQKIPPTIHSRCQRYGFKRISLQELTSRLRHIATTEGISVSDLGLAMIARAAEGSMRDAQSLMDQAISYSGTDIKDVDLQSIFGAVAQDALTAFTKDILGRDTAAVLSRTDGLLEQGVDLRQFLAGLVEHARNLLVARTAADPGRILELPAPDMESIKQQAREADPERLILIFDSLSRTLDEMRWSANQRFTFEVGLIKLCSIQPLRPLGEILGRVQSLEARLGPSAYLPARQAGEVRDAAAPYASGHGAAARTRTESGGAGGGADWERVLAALKSARPSLASALAHSRLLERSGDVLTIGVKGGSFNLGLAEKKENRTFIEEQAQKALGTGVKIAFRPLDADRPAAGKSSEPRKRTVPAEPDPIVQDALQIFGGEHIPADTENDA